MKLTRFDPPGMMLEDFDGDPKLLDQWSEEASRFFDAVRLSIQTFLNSKNGGAPQFYDPVAHGIEGTDKLLDITWNGFPKRFTGGGTVDYGAADDNLDEGQTRLEAQARLQDEYLEWFVDRDSQGKIVRVQFTCEEPEYWKFLAKVRPDYVVTKYRQLINPAVKKEDLFVNDQYDPLNIWNTARGAMHTTYQGNHLSAALKFVADATVRRLASDGTELTTSKALIKSTVEGQTNRNSDPAVGYDVNGLARQGFMITLANPIGPYMASFKGDGLVLPNGEPAAECFQVLRGRFPEALRAEFRVPAAAAARGWTVSDVRLGDRPIAFGGQLAELITMKLTVAACAKGSVTNPLQPLGLIRYVGSPASSVHGDRAVFMFNYRPN